MMSASRGMRASDQDRDWAAGVLSEAYAVGRLSGEELDERSAAAYSAQTWGQLQDLTADLPVAPTAWDLPSDAVATRDATRRAFAPVIWMGLIALAASLAGRILPAAVWIIAAASTAPALLYAARRNRSGRPSRGGGR